MSLFAALEPVLPFPASAVVLVALLESSLKESAADIRMLAEALLLFSDSDSDAAVEAEADLLSLAAALALSLELALWLLLMEEENVSDSEAERLAWLWALSLVAREAEETALTLPCGFAGVAAAT